MILSEDQYNWIGLNDLASSGSWKWQNSFDPADYTNWFSGEPDRTGDCVFTVYYKDQKWGDHNCRFNHGGSGNDGNPIHALCEAHN